MPQSIFAAEAIDGGTGVLLTNRHFPQLTVWFLLRWGLASSGAKTNIVQLLLHGTQTVLPQPILF
ncbi:hypothetical protein [Microbulbifer variabilis]|uniref:hypothetical protein n=1 Tax=Microbulbifer variabilis TaxID=266805 RepID=UPI001CFD3771|nr:hypothetical protein [Microbulbifer variabilis]